MTMKIIINTVFLLFLPSITVVNAQGSLQNCDSYRDNLKQRINQWRNHGASDNTVINFICDSSFRANLLEEMNNGLQGTPLLTIDLTPRCEMKRSSDNRLCREIFAEESVKDRANCIKHNGCIYDEAKCRGEGGCASVDLSGAANANAAAQRCLDHNDKCHYEPAPGTNVCIQKDLNGFFYNNPESRNLLEQAFRGDTEAECRDIVQSELNTARRRLNEIGDSPILDYVAIVLDANDWEEDNFDANAFAAAVTDKKNLVFELLEKGMTYIFWLANWFTDMVDDWYYYWVGVQGFWYFEDRYTIHGWSCDKWHSSTPNTVGFTFGEEYDWAKHLNPWGYHCGGYQKVTANLPSDEYKDVICNGGTHHGFEFNLTEVQRNCIDNGDGQVYVWGVGHARANSRLLPGSTGNRIDDRLEVKDRSASRAHDSSSFADHTKSIEQDDLNEVEQEIMKELDDVEEDIMKELDIVGDDNNILH